MPHRLKVLLIEDDTLDTETIRQALTDIEPDHVLLTAHDGEQALKILREQEIPYPYIILLDLSLPKIDGFTVLQELRREPLLRRSVVFIVTGSAADAHKQRTYQEGIAGYLLKERLGSRYEHLAAFLVAYHRIIEYPLRSES